MTNRDKLNAMSNEELADNFCFLCKLCPHRYDCENVFCRDAFLEWLESEVDE